MHHRIFYTENKKCLYEKQKIKKFKKKWKKLTTNVIYIHCVYILICRTHFSTFCLITLQTEKYSLITFLHLILSFSLKQQLNAVLVKRCVIKYITLVHYLLHNGMGEGWYVFYKEK